ncbi:Rid family detoxifying hydrolase [Chitinophaga pendula]|uniref:Rid family detoxifying hydrolase n=1 Tax=Chitinophaga TaxID=79328 RepID=UPI000BB04467|nr:MULTISPECIES: Rid family detoxifying hydrolase [Chitinophaga]ASZ13481.1 hypothetical protein CK934_22230 [Chitinophaga sp. MD30]UCJ08892.1 Rid family detoxifying hydrolase [Chitinophaga pendula]
MHIIGKVILVFILLAGALPVFSQEKQPVRPYSSARASHGMLYVSGQVGIDPATGKLANETFEKEVSVVMGNIREILRQSGIDLSAIVNVTVYLKDMSQYAVFNRLYTLYFTAPFPARSCVAVKDLAAGANLEVSVVASLKE